MPCKKIFFDLDGTVYPLYDQEGWLDKLHASDPSAYAVEDTMVPSEELLDALCDLMGAGYEIGVISWLARNASKEYEQETREVKRAWIKKFLPMASEIHIVRYGTPKQGVIRKQPLAILVDDDANVRAAWCHGLTIDPTKNLIKRLRSLI